MFLKVLFLIILAIHAIIHLFAFFKAFNIAGKNLITKPLSQFEGFLWLLSSILFLLTIILFIFHYRKWFYFGFIAIVFSQILIFFIWNEARYGTVINLIILSVIGLKFSCVRFENKFKKESLNYLKHYVNIIPEVVDSEALNKLPNIVKKYINYCNLQNNKKIYNFFVKLNGRMFIKKEKEFYFQSRQYNFLDKNIRLFFMKARFFGIPVYAYHKYVDGHASMIVKICGIIPIVNAKGEVMNVSETVTYFNDICLFSPLALVYKNIQWTEINDTTVTAKFFVNNIFISAQLIFNNDGKLINFISYDRTDIKSMKKFPFYTPISEYNHFGNFYLPSYGKAQWYYPDGPFTYIEVKVCNIFYNLRCQNLIL